jgi:hypothetical protein
MRGPEVVRAWFGAFAARDRAGAERLMAEGLRFTSREGDFDNVEHGVVHDGRIESTRVFFGKRAFGDEE